jgi:hypothetical protein
VLTSRHSTFPRTDNALQWLGPEFPHKFSSRTYRVGDHLVSAFFLQHPQGARGELMRRAIKYALDRPNL